MNLIPSDRRAIVHVSAAEVRVLMLILPCSTRRDRVRNCTSWLRDMHTLQF